MKYTIFLALIFATCFLTACKKNFILDDPNPVVRTTEAAPKLLKNIYLDTTKPAGLDTIRNIKLKYDAQNRIVEILNLEIDELDSVRFETIKFYYTGNDSMAYKSSNLIRDYVNGIYNVNNGGNGYEEIYYKYINGNRTQDSTIEYHLGIATYTKVVNYNYMGNNNIIASTNGYTGGGTTSTFNAVSYINLIKNNSNHVFFSDSTHEAFLGNNYYVIDSKDYVSTSFFNPYYHIYKSTAPIRIDEHEGEYHYTLNANRNLPSKYIFTSKELEKNNIGITQRDALDIYTTDFTYTLRNDGYPISAIEKTSIVERYYTINTGTSTSLDNLVTKVLYIYE